MNARNSLRFGLLSLAVLVLTTFAPSASAGVVGTLVVASCSSQDVFVTSLTIDWALTGSNGPLCIGGGTHINSVGDGNLIVNPGDPAFTGTATINDLGPAYPAPGDAGFMTITGGGLLTGLYFNLAQFGGLGPGTTTDCSTNPLPGSSCSIMLSPGVYSPFLLTSTASDGGHTLDDVNGASVTLLANGTIYDSGDLTTTKWSGSFTTQIGQTPAAIESTILEGGQIMSSFSGQFDAAPEPVSMALIGGGLLALAALKRRKRA